MSSSPWRFTPPAVPPLDTAALPDGLRDLVRDAAPITMGFSGDGVYDCGDYILKSSRRVSRLSRERDVLLWLCGKLPISEVFWFGERDGCAFLLTSKLEGKMAQECDLGDIAGALCEGLELLNSVDTSCCPFDSRTDTLLRHARALVESNQVSTDDWERDTPFKSPEELLLWLLQNRPEGETTAFLHGDFCLPNVFIKNGRFSGFCDLGGAGVGDRWFDLALCVRSMGYNRVGDSGVNTLFSRLGLPFDQERIRYYILLDELF